MGVYRKYRDNEGRPTGPWFVKYPYKRDKATGKLKYKIEKVGPSKKLAQRIYSTKYEEYKKREHLDWNEERPFPFNEVLDWYLNLPGVRGRTYYEEIVRYCEKWRKYFGEMLIEEIKPSMVEQYRQERLQERYIQLDAEDTKTRQPRIIYFNETLHAILSRLSKVRHLNHNYLFTYHGKPIKSIKTCLNRACTKVGIEDFRFHDLRHTFNTMMRKAGVARSVIMHFTGHKTSAMFDRYNTIDEDDAKDALRKLDRFLEEAGEEKGRSEECSHSAPKEK